MGYDMSVVDEDGRTVRDCDEPSHGEHYWRRNIFGAGTQAQRLVDVGMAYWSDLSNRVKWPEPSDYGVEHNDDYDYDDENGVEWIGDRVDEYLAAHHAMLKATYNESPGIAAYKLCDTNDGWWVSKAECESALKLWEQAGEPEVDKYGDTIPFLRAAAAHSGFRVW